MKAIMVPVANRPECAKALESSFRLARELGGNVVGYHLRPHEKESKKGHSRKAEAPYRSHDWQAGVSKRQIDLDSKGAEKLFDELAEQHGFVRTRKTRYEAEGGLALWHSLTGDPEHVFSIIGPLSDLIVVSRPKSSKSVKARTFAHAALTCSGRPVLHLPQRKLATLGQHIVILWNQSEQASAAVMASMPLLRNAKKVSIVGTKSGLHLGPTARHLQDQLRLHNIKADLVITKGRDQQAEIEQSFKQVGGDLIVMGAYSRPRWRERIFGGLTMHMLEKTQIPVLMLHTSD